MTHAASARLLKTRLIELRGVFDQAAALRMRKTLTEDRQAYQLALDFAGVTRFDGSLALLAVSLIVLHRNGRRFHISGLDEEARKFLLHFGVSIADDGRTDFLLRDELPFCD